MNEREATTFEQMSEKNYAIVAEALECDCIPYQDVFTLKRWNKQNMKVKKGSKAIKVQTFIPAKDKDGEITKTKPKYAYLFCRCQVEPFNPKNVKQESMFKTADNGKQVVKKMKDNGHKQPKNIEKQPQKNIRSTITILKENDQDYEWYPTTDEMISVVRARIPMDAESIMDIGAGDGRVLMAFLGKCENALLYGIEKSLGLIQIQDKKIIPVGTEFYEQNLSALPVQYIFCNPPYSDFETWCEKIITEGYAKEAFLVIPERWKNSEIIADALKRREATAESIYSGNFLNGDRKSRAKVDIVRVQYKSSTGYSRNWQSRVADPFDQWFDQNITIFDKAKEPESGIGQSKTEKLKIKLRGSDIEAMVDSYQMDYAKLERNYRAIFELDADILTELGIDKDAIREGLKKKLKGLKITYWGILFDRLDAITSRLSTKSRQSLLDKLVANNTIDFTVKNALAIGLWAINNANQYLDDQLVELFENLATFDGMRKYKSNQATWIKSKWRYQFNEFSNFKLDYRIVVSKYQAMYNGGYSQYQFPGDLHNRCHDLIADMWAVFSNLGFKVSDIHSKSRDWKRGQWQNFTDIEGKTIFQVKAYMNGNMHIRVMPKAMQALNIKAAQLLKWIGSIDEIVEEMEVDKPTAEKYYNWNQYINVKNLPLLQDKTED